MTMTRAEVERICKEARDAGEFPYLSGLDLSGLDLRLVDLTGADLSLVDLSLVDLWGSNMSGANMSGANMSGANLWRSNMSGANMSGANLCDTNLCDTNLTGVDLSGSDLSDARLIGADMSGAVIRGTNLSGTNLSGTFQSRGSIVLSLTGLPSGPDHSHRVDSVPVQQPAGPPQTDGPAALGAWRLTSTASKPSLTAITGPGHMGMSRPSVVPAYRRGLTCAATTSPVTQMSCLTCRPSTAEEN